MKTTKNIIILIFLLAVSIGFTTSCKLDDMQESPNAATPDAANLDLLFNGVQTNFGSFVTSGQFQPMAATRVLTMSGVYNNAFAASGFNGKWSTAYSGLLPDSKILLRQTDGVAEYKNMNAVTKILTSYTLTTLVDYFGDVPYSEATTEGEILNPKLDSGQDVYNEALKLLNEAIETLKNNDDSADLPQDLFYEKDMDKWLTLAYTLKLRWYNNTKFVDEATSKTNINELIANGDLIDKASENFVWKYGISKNEPDTRSPYYVGSLTRGSYLGQYLMNIMKNDYGSEDPRIYYYYYRQSETYPGTDEQGLFDRPCQRYAKPSHYSANDPYCNSVGDGYWGRDHGNNEGVPSDNDKITLFGLYPFGLKFDNNSFSAFKDDEGAGGKGYQPIFMSSWTYFIQAESALSIGTTGNPKDLFLKGVEESMKTVRDFNTEVPKGSNMMTDPIISNYLNLLTNDYDNATNKLDLVMKQFYIATFGNGSEAYNNYRRTGYPSDIQPNIEASPGKYIRSFKYPDNARINNINIEQKPDQTVKVFWDKNPSLSIDF